METATRVRKVCRYAHHFPYVLLPNAFEFLFEFHGIRRPERARGCGELPSCILIGFRNDEASVIFQRVQEWAVVSLVDLISQDHHEQK